MTVNYFIENVLLPEINSKNSRHFALNYHSLQYPVYIKSDQEKICLAIENCGFHVRVGIAGKYKGRQGLQIIVFECSKEMKFNCMFTDQISGEIEFGVNS